MNIVITGVSRGIGLALTELALKNGHTVLGIARMPEESSELQALSHKYPSDLSILKMDLNDENMGDKLKSAVQSWPVIDILINNAGIYEKGTTKSEFLRSFEVNTITPYLVTEMLLGKLRESKTAKVVSISSLMGSIHDNSSGEYYAYRASKAALNMINKSLSIDHAWLTCLVIHPGWVQTRMGGISAPVTVTESAEGIWKVIHETGLRDSGSFIDFRGKKLSW